MIAAAFHDPAVPDRLDLEPALVQLNRREGPPLRRIGVTAVQAGDGVTSLSRQLAGLYARRDLDVVLIEANWAKPALAAAYGLSGKPGFADIVLGAVAPLDGVHAVADGFHVVPAGTPASIREAGLDDVRVEAFLGLVDQRYHLAILDCAPIGQIGDTAALSPLVDGFVVVVGAERTRRVVAEQAMRDLDAAGGTALGVVLNRTRRPIPDWLYRRLG
ncbi:CpsD/CapB family tyrosine-protein kinase [Methylobacterium sp. E-041]|uniref:CpsD/CapB family tyrosine-protein kinase n=1 Tax=Methylobacterium sp. E-041 TaxID=2836573 RepID=UPI001FB8D094|nr:CpsD/CapB family tyrosine-protein kinase [Methylobacterium sp. E-041]MCJ2107553.1 CpsD/CapB family tyrosine-protein kinase [Methylobacterium sp. E-041]